MAISDGGDELSRSDELSFSWGDKLSDVGDLSSNPYEAFKEKSLLPFLDFPLTLLTSLAKPTPTTFTSLFLSLAAERFPLKMKAPHLQKGLPPLSTCGELCSSENAKKSPLCRWWTLFYQHEKSLELQLSLILRRDVHAPSTERFFFWRLLQKGPHRMHVGWETWLAVASLHGLWLCFPKRWKPKTSWKVFMIQNRSHFFPPMLSMWSPHHLIKNPCIH